MSIKKDILLRVRIALFGVVFLVLLILYKLLDIQYWNEKDWRKISEKQSVRKDLMPATRGNIYSDNGGLLATSIPTYKLAFDAKISLRGEEEKRIFEEGIHAFSENLAHFFGDHSAKHYYQLINDARRRKKGYLFISNKSFNYHDKKMMEQWPIVKAGKYKGGVIFEKQEQRLLPFKDLGRRMIGKVQEVDSLGRGIKGYGIEYSFDSLLAGRNGEALFVKTGATRRPISDGKDIKPVHGLDVVTTIDVNIQDVAETVLHDALEYHKADNGCVVVMEVQTGEIKAMANLSYQKSGPYQGKYLEDLNHAVGRVKEPGSTFKLASFMALLSENSKIKLSDSVETGNGRYSFFQGEAVMTDAKPGGYGKLSVAQVFEKSSNIGLSKLMYETFGKDPKSRQKFYNYLSVFGLTEVIPFQIDNEAYPNVKKVEDWSGITLPWMSIGYEVEMSPLQILTFYNGVANDGKMISPIIVKEVRRANKVYASYKGEVLRKKLCSDKVLREVRQMLEGVVERGTAKSIRSNYYKIAGKTGTAKKIIDGTYSNSYYSSFVGYFPADNPKYSIIVAIDNPRENGLFGGDVSAPIFKQISDRIYSQDMTLNKAISNEFAVNRSMYPVVQAGNFEELSYLLNDFGVSYWGENVQSSWVKAYIDSELKTIKWNEIQVQKDRVPDVRGMRLRDALYILENLGLHVEFDGRGRVATQSLLPKSILVVGSTIKLTLN